SGTTGKPKGVMLSHGNFLANGEGVQFWLLELVPEDLSLSYLPLSHVFERTAGHFIPLSVGVTIAYAESIDTIPENLLEIKRTILTSVPRLFEKVYGMVWDEINEGSAVKQKVFNWALSIGEQRYDMYQNAEMDALIKQTAMPQKFMRKWKLADRLVFSQVKEKIGGRVRSYLELMSAQEGEVLVKVPSIMQGYYNAPGKPAEELVDGWYKTGDMGELDQNDYLKISYRNKRIIVLSTRKNVAPQSIQN